jgi:O-antigen ligase
MTAHATYIVWNDDERRILARTARWLAFGSAVTILVSIAASQLLLALAVAALMLSGEPLRLPHIRLPLALFLLGTILALLFSGEITAGLPQVRKMFVFLELLVVFSSVRDLAFIRALFLGWAGFAAIGAIRGAIQFFQKVQLARQAHADYYQFYVGERITGFMSHWNTFSAGEMFALILLASFLFFSPAARKRTWLWLLCAALMAMAVLLAETRAVWIATAIALLYLLWNWKRWMVLLVPIAAAVAFLASPGVIRARFTSFMHPQDVDSNEFRIVTWRTGERMVEAHPIFGIGPEGPNRHFEEWVPADIKRPLPVGWYGHLHNIYLQYAAERGIPTLLILLWMMGMMLYDFTRGLRTLPPGRGDPRFLLHAGVAVILATLAEGFFEYNLGDSEVLTMFLVVVACAYLAREKDVAAAA